MPQKLAATFSNVCCLKYPKYFGYSNSYEFYKSMILESLGKGDTWDTMLIAVDNLFENPARKYAQISN